MAASSFTTHPFALDFLLESCNNGKIQLPDFQRSWVWDEERIKSLVASISRSFPIGALMTLATGGEVNFKPRTIEGASKNNMNVIPEFLLLDGQQRMTSLYQVTLRGEVVKTITPKNKKVSRWFYIDIMKALDSKIDREEAILSIPEDKRLKKDFGREVLLDVSTPELEYKNFMYPVSKVFDWDDWQDGFNEFWRGDLNEDKRAIFKDFKKKILDNFKKYNVPVISLDKATTKEAVCVVFEKVNTGGKALDAFELVTAMYAADGHELRKDWLGDEHSPGRQRRFIETARPPGAEEGILAGISNTDFLHAVSLFYTRDRRRAAEELGKSGKELPAVSGNRQALLNLPLEAYKKYEKKVEEGFTLAAKFLHLLHIYKVKDLPYQSQVIPLAAILADIGSAWEHTTSRALLVKWYWNGVFGELYGSTIDSRIARDFMEVPAWLKGGPEPTTVSETMFRSDRLKTMRTRLSAAYKGMNALLMKAGATDFRSGQKFDHTVLFGENVDIHHIFPQDWCKKENFKPSIFDSIINKTPLSFKTNRILGGVSPSQYLKKLEEGSKEYPPIEAALINEYLNSHLIDPHLLRSDNFKDFMTDRQNKLLDLIENATGKKPSIGEDDSDDESVDI